jgi:hypothetical protein
MRSNRVTAVVPLLIGLALPGGSLTATASGPDEPEARPVFTGAVGFGIQTPAGRGGRVIKVTNLDASGPGSLAEALHAEGPRLVAFEVGGVIDLGGMILKITRPFLTVAGQTAPSPGITLIHGGIGISTHDVLLRHLRIRTGDADRARGSGWKADGLSTVGAWDVVIDHCSIAWATDENLSASGPRFDGQGVEQWRANTSHDVTFSHSIIAEGLSRSTHRKGEHSKGGLVHDNVTRIAVIGNLYASNVDCNPLFKGGVRGVIANKVIDNPGRKAVHYRLVAREWAGRPYVTGRMALVGNVLRYGPDTGPGRALFSYDGDGPLELYADDNLASDRSGRPVETVTTANGARAESLQRVDAPPLWPEGFRALPAARVREAVLDHAGARPWDRDEVVRRIVRQVAEGTGGIIDSQGQVGGYPAHPATTRTLDVPMDHREEWLDSFCLPDR